MASVLLTVVRQAHLPFAPDNVAAQMERVPSFQMLNGSTLNVDGF
jgi:hypothetical protein